MHENSVMVSKEGRIAIPAKLRRKLGISAGDVLSVKVVDGELILSTKAVLLKRLRAAAGPPLKNELLSEQLIKERREAARKE